MKIKTEGFIIFANSLILIAGFAALLFLNKNQLKEIAIDQHAQSMKVFSSVIEKSILQNTTNTTVIPTEQSVIPTRNEVSSGEVEESSTPSLDTIIKNLAGENLNFRISVIDSSGRVVADSDTQNISQIENHLNRQEVFDALGGKESIAIRQSTVNDGDELYFATPFVLDGDNYALRLSAPIDSNIFFSGNYLLKMIVGSVIVLVAILFFSILISAHVIIGIDELKNAASHYQRGQFNFESNVKSPRELSELSQTMNAMASTIGKNVERLKELERVRKDFVANVSNELKTPITSIKGFSETLLDGAIDDTEAAKNFVGIIKTQSDRLENIIEDLLTLSKLENSDAQIEFETFDVIGLVRSLCDEYKPIAAKKEIVVSFASSIEKCEKKISPHLFYQGLANIFDNAIKYCPNNSVVSVNVEPVITPTASIVTPTNAEGVLQKIKISIEDNGAGIPEKYRPRIFERFYRVDKGRSREQGGTGLGLSITKHIVELHGGTIQCVAAKNFSSGARFEIVL